MITTQREERGHLILGLGVWALVWDLIPAGAWPMEAARVAVLALAPYALIAGVWAGLSDRSFWHSYGLSVTHFVFHHLAAFGLLVTLSYFWTPPEDMGCGLGAAVFMFMWPFIALFTALGMLLTAALSRWIKKTVDADSTLTRQRR